MTNRSEDITVRIRADYANALRDVQYFTGNAGREFQGLPRIVQQASASVDTLGGKLARMGDGSRPQALAVQLGQLPRPIYQAIAAADILTVRFDRMGATAGPRNLSQQVAQLSPVLQRAGSFADAATVRVDRIGRSPGPASLLQQVNHIPKAVQQVGTALDGLTLKLDRIGGSYAPRQLHDQMAQLPAVIQHLSGSIDALTGKVGRLGRDSGIGAMNRDLRESNRQATALSVTFETLKNQAKAIGAGAAGFVAGKMVFQPHMEKMVDYDTKLANLANVVHADKSPAERIAAKADLNKAVNEATRVGGGTRDEAADTLGKLVGSGVVSDKDATAMLPSIMKGATAAGAAPSEIADIGIRAMQNFNFKADELPRLLDMAIKSGNMGGFELKDMAKWLPAQMAEASALGMKGEQGFAQLLALNQAAITTAGSTDAAGNNVRNLLAKINSTDTQQDFKKMGVNLSGSLQAALGNGVDPITAFSQLIDRVMSKDKNYVTLEEKRKSAGSEAEKLEMLEKQIKLAEGTAVGKVLQDQQARSAFLGFKQQGEAFKRQITDTTGGAADGTTAGNFAVIAEGPGFKRQQSLNDQLNAQNDALQKLVPALNTYWEWTSAIARQYPVLSTAIEGSKIAAVTLGASAGSASIVMALLTRNATGAAAALGMLPGAAARAAVTGTGVPPAAAAAVSAAPVLVAEAVLAGGVLATATAANTVADNPEYFRTSIGDDGLAANIMLASQQGQEERNKAAARQAEQPPVDAFAKQLNDSGGSAEAMRREIQEGFKNQAISAKINLQIGMDESMRPVIKQQSVSGKNVDLSTGPMMTG